MDKGPLQDTLNINCKVENCCATRNSSWLAPGLYKDRVKNKKNNFEIPAFLKFERGTLRAGKFKSLYSLYIIDFYQLIMCKSCGAMVEHRTSERNASPAVSSIPGRSYFFSKLNLYHFKFSRSCDSSLESQKGGDFKIIFLVLYPIFIHTLVLWLPKIALFSPDFRSL